MLTSWQNQKRTLKRLSFEIRCNRMFLNGALPALPAAAICSCNSSTSNITLVVVLAVVTTIPVYKSDRAIFQRQVLFFIVTQNIHKRSDGKVYLGYNTDSGIP
ncbi:hypothetical protein PV326_003064 [Microctonus aethiopoides]|nr:hypothetical protein PV326_003064 [Microctonus aethiopoides]